MKCPQTKFQAHTVSEYQVFRSKRCQNFSLGQNLSLGKTFLASPFFSLYQYFIETTTTDIDLLLQILLQFCNNNNGFAAISDVIILFCPLLDDLILRRLGVVRQETWSYSTCLVSAQSIKLCI